MLINAGPNAWISNFKQFPMFQVMYEYSLNAAAEKQDNLWNTMSFINIVFKFLT